MSISLDLTQAFLNLAQKIQGGEITAPQPREYCEWQWVPIDDCTTTCTAYNAGLCCCYGMRPPQPSPVPQTTPQAPSPQPTQQLPQITVTTPVQPAELVNLVAQMMPLMMMVMMVSVIRRMF